MIRPLDNLLALALFIATVGSLVMLSLMVLDLFVPARWNWHNAMAFFVATAALAGARYLHSLVAKPGVQQQP